MKSSKKLQISSHLLFVYINNRDRKWRMSVLVFSSALQPSALKWIYLPILVHYEREWCGFLGTRWQIVILMFFCVIFPTWLFFLDTNFLNIFLTQIIFSECSILKYLFRLRKISAAPGFLYNFPHFQIYFRCLVSYTIFHWSWEQAFQCGLWCVERGKW